MSITFLRLDMKYMYTSLDINGDGLQLALIDRPEFEIIDVCDWWCHRVSHLELTCVCVCTVNFMMSIDTNTKGKNPLLHEHNITFNGVSEELKKKIHLKRWGMKKICPREKAWSSLLSEVFKFVFLGEKNILSERTPLLIWSLKGRGHCSVKKIRFNQQYRAYSVAVYTGRESK